MDANPLARRIEAGQHTAVVGARAEIAAEPGWAIVRVGCASTRRPLGPLLMASERIGQLVGGDDGTPQRRKSDKRSDRLKGRLLGDVPERAGAEGLMAALNTLAEAGTTCALVFDDVEQADEATLGLLMAAVGREGWCRVPLVLGFGQEPADGAARDLLDTVVEVFGPDAVLRYAQAEVAAPAERRATGASRELPADARLVLSAAALVDGPFQAELIAQLLGSSDLAVLWALQEAADAGLVVEDDGDGTFRIDDAIAAELRDRMLPSLKKVLHGYLSDLFFDDQPRPSMSTMSAMGTVPAPSPQDEEEGLASLDPSIFDGAEEDQRGWLSDPVRAADHAEAAGDEVATAIRLLAAAREATVHGAHEQAEQFMRDALERLNTLPQSPGRQILQIEALVELGRLYWEASSPDGSFSLDDALGALNEAVVLLEDGAAAAAEGVTDGAPLAVDLEADARALLAHVLYDLGDPASLERALEELTIAIRKLQVAGNVLAATSLLNDQAAVWVRIGDPVRAAHLLRESRAVFEARAADEPLALAELAETDHLLARLPLHVAAQPGHQAEAYAMALGHAKDAAERFETLNYPIEHARTMATIGQLHMMAGDHEAAVDALGRAADAQRQLADVLGLARTAGVLAELLSSEGRTEEALGLLADSVRLNLTKGSPRGLAYNRRTLEHITGAVAPERVAKVGPSLEAVQALLTRAEHQLGRIDLPASDLASE